MTRKRLKKLLMAEGYDRDSAVAAIDQCMERGMTHEEAYEELAGDHSVIAAILRSAICNDEFIRGLQTLNAAIESMKAELGERITRVFSSVG